MKRILAILLAMITFMTAIGMAESRTEEIKTGPNRKLVFDQETYEIYTGVGKKANVTIEKLTEDAPKTTKLIWTSSDTEILKVSNGMLQGVKTGTAEVTVRASDDETIAAAAKVVVLVHPKQIKLSQQHIQLVLGADEKAKTKTIEYTIMPEDASEKGIIWTVKDETIAAVDENGTVTALAPGSTILTAVSKDTGVKVTAQCRLIVGEAVSAVTLSETELTLNKGQAKKLNTAIEPKNPLNKTLEWSSSDESIVKVDKSGTLQAKAKGKAIITCKTTDGSNIIETCKVTVIQPAQSLKLNTQKVVLFEGTAKKVSAEITPKDVSKKELKWSSENYWIASVDAYGTITGKHAGKTTITASTIDGTNKKAVVNVIIEPSNPITIESLGWGVYMPNLIGITVRNLTSAKTISNFDFEMTLYAYNGDIIDQGTYSIGENVSIGPGAKKTIKRNVGGAGYAKKIVYKIYGVSFKDGTYRYIPTSEQEVWTFTR